MYRKRENQRIERENHGIATRLYHNVACINMKSINNDYNNQLKYKNMISKAKKSKPVFQGRFHLPPLRRSSLQATMMNVQSDVLISDVPPIQKESQDLP